MLRESDLVRFYEINPTVEEIARVYFYYLGEAKCSVDVVIGDGRLSLERERPQDYDLLAVDAFSSDSIPVHLLTEQALELYFRHLKRDASSRSTYQTSISIWNPWWQNSAQRFGKNVW